MLWQRCWKAVRVMSRLDELIKELCPDGVEYREISTAVNIVGGKDYKNLNEGEIPVYGSGGVMCYVDKAAYDKPSVLLPRKGSISNVFYVTEPFWNVDTIFYTEIDLEQLIPRYFYHVMLNAHIEDYNTSNAARPALTRTVLNKIKIPIPPLPVQEEIVKILDKFTDYVTELQAELQARKQQYEYYCNHLMADNKQAKWVKLSEIADIGTGSSNTNEGLEEGLYPFYVRSQEPLRKNEYEYDETAIITAGDGVGVGKVYHFAEGKYALHQRAYRIHINTKDVIPKYYFYYMRNAFLSYIEKNMFHGSVASIRRPMLNEFPVPVPPVDEQLRIIDILDRFDILINDIKAGLPAEIEARQKQYEYYRDKLLSFKEIEL